MKSPYRRCLAIILTSAIAAAVLFPAAAVAGSGESRLRAVDHKCIGEGLRPLPVSLTAHVVSQEGGRVNTPDAVVVWSGIPLPRSCDAHVSVSFDIHLWFKKLSLPLDLGAGPEGWQVFWSGGGKVHRARKVYKGPTFTAPIGCLAKSRGRLHYRVIGNGGEVLAQRKEAVPVRGPSCA